MDSMNSKIVGHSCSRTISHRLNLTDKINLERSDEYVALSRLNIYYTWKNIKILKYQLLPKINNLNYMMHQILYKIFKVILNIS